MEFFCFMFLNLCVQKGTVLKKHLQTLAVLVLCVVVAFPLTAGRPQTKSNEKKVAANLEVAKKLVFENQDTALSILQSITHLLNGMGTETKALYYNTYGLYYWFEHDYETSILMFDSTLQLPDIEKHVEYQVEAINNAGTLSSKLGRMDSAIAYLEKALEIDESRNNTVGIAKTSYDLGMAYGRKAQYYIALRHYLKAKDIHEADENVNRKRQMNTYNVLGNLYHTINDTASAIHYYQLGLQLAEKESDSTAMGMISDNLASLFLDSKQPARALLYSRKSLGYYETMEMDPEDIVAIYGNMATAFMALGMKDSAQYYSVKAKRFYGGLQPEMLSKVFVNHARILLETNRLDSAKLMANQAVTIANSIENASTLAQAFHIMSSIDSAMGNFEAALGFYQRYTAIRDSIFDNEHKSRVAELNIIYETDKNEAENKNLLAQNILKQQLIVAQWLVLALAAIGFVLMIYFVRRLKQSNQRVQLQQQTILQKNDELHEINKTKDKFISIIAHDLRSPFNGLLGLLSDLVENFDSYDDSEKLELLGKTYKSSVNTHNLLENLLDWAKGQLNGFENKPEMVSVEQAVQKVIQVLEPRATKKNIKLSADIPNEIMVFVDPHILINILINLVNNAIKFTDAGGEVKVEASAFESLVRVCVKDNGIGIPAQKLTNLFNLGQEFKRQGTSKEPGTGLGLVLVKEFLTVSNGSITVESEEGNGSIFCFYLPENQPERDSIE